jgi:aminopeptidase
MADEAGLTLDEYWAQIIEACYLSEDDPVAKWRQVQAEIEEIKDKLDALQIEKLHIKGNDINLEIQVRQTSQMAKRGWQEYSKF